MYLGQYRATGSGREIYVQESGREAIYCTFQEGQRRFWSERWEGKGSTTYAKTSPAPANSGGYVDAKEWFAAEQDKNGDSTGR